MDGGNILIAIIMALSIPIAVVLAVVWGVVSIVKARYRAREGDMSSTEREELRRLSVTADRMAERIATLEAILDAELPDWREDHERGR